MKKVVLMCCAAAAMFMTASCDQKGPEGYQGTNHINLYSEVNSMYDTEDAELNVTVELTASLGADLELTFTTDDTENIITMEGNPVTIKAGEKTASFAIKAAKISSNSKEFTLTLDKSTVLPEKVEWKEDFTFTVKSSAVEELTDAQKAIVEAYKKATGIDLSQYLGFVKCEMTFTYRDYENGDRVVTGDPVKTATIIGLSESATAEAPVLMMTDNAMGVNEIMYNNLRKLTVLTEDWNTEYEGNEGFMLMKEIGWNKDSQETFNVTLDGIKLNAQKEISFVEKVLDNYEEEIQAVPFGYSFSAYERQLQKTDLELTYVTADPDYYLNNYEISYDYIEWAPEDDTLTEKSLWEEASASISGEKLEFRFCFSDDNYSDYAKVHVVYTPNK